MVCFLVLGDDLTTLLREITNIGRELLFNLLLNGHYVSNIYRIQYRIISIKLCIKFLKRCSAIQRRKSFAVLGK